MATSLPTPETPFQIVSYYANLLILQYLGKPKAYSTIFSTVAPVVMPQTSVQNITFSSDPVSGSFVLQYNGTNTSSIAWNDSASTIQSALRAIPGLSEVTVTGSISSQSLTVTFTGVIPPAYPLSSINNLLLDVTSEGVEISIVQTDQTLPLAVSNGYNLIGSNPAIGAQLDVLGKYAGVTRSGFSPHGNPITLDDSDFLTLIKFAIVTNNSGSSLQDIENSLNVFFPGKFICLDSAQMTLLYFFSADLGSSNLFLLLASEKLIPAPMGVGISAVLPPGNNVFGFQSYSKPLNASAFPFNTYDNYNTSWYWLSYQNSLL